MSITFFRNFLDEAHSALAAMLDQSADCIKLIDLDGGIAYMNENGQTAMEIADFAALIGQRWDQLWPEANRGDILHSLAEARRGRKYRFEGFCPTALGNDRWWDVMVSPMRDDSGQVTRVLAISRDITEQVQLRKLVSQRLADAERTAEVQVLSASESRHRLKNLLAVVQAISNLVVRHSKDLTDYADRFGGHLRRLASAQNLLAGVRPEGHALSAVIDGALDAAGGDSRIVVDGVPDVAVAEDAVQVAALVFGELHTNAIKHGALARDAGSVKIDVAREGEGIRVLWREDCGAPIEPRPLTGGSGIELITRMTRLSGRAAEIHLEPRGLTASFWLPTAG